MNEDTLASYLESEAKRTLAYNIGFDDGQKAKTLTEDEVSKYWYNKGHEDGRKLATEQSLLTDDELKAFLRFCECVEDGEGYDVPKEMMIRLSWIGVIKSLPRDCYENTEFGNYILKESSEK